MLKKTGALSATHSIHKAATVCMPIARAQRPPLPPGKRSTEHAHAQDLAQESYRPRRLSEWRRPARPAWCLCFVTVRVRWQWQCWASGSVAVCVAVPDCGIVFCENIYGFWDPLMNVNWRLTNMLVTEPRWRWASSMLAAADGFIHAQR